MSVYSATNGSSLYRSAKRRGVPGSDKATVWIRPLANGLLVRAEGLKQVEWLLKRLSHSFVFKTCEPVVEDFKSHCAFFRLDYSSRIPRRELERVFAAISEIQVMLDVA